MALYAFDGTWNEEHDTGVYGINTNVVEFYRAYRDDKLVSQSPADEKRSTVRKDFLVGGPGVRHGWLGKWAGGAFGAGGRVRIKEAMSALAARFAEGDEIVDIIGFSRGAALALHFANVLGKETVRGKTGALTKPRVRFLGLWDTVAAFGIPLDVGPFHFQRINLGYKLSLPEHVDYCFHAMALDERRDAFRVTRVENAYEVWFRGAHSDVGGGNQNAALSGITLTWMLRKAVTAGLPMNAAAAKLLPSDPAAAIKHSKRGPMKKFREVKANDLFHYTVAQREVPECQNRPGSCSVESEVDEANSALTTAEIRGRS